MGVAGLAGKTPEAMRIYARMQAKQYADYVDLATKSDAEAVIPRDLPEIDPEQLVAEQEAAIEAMDADARAADKAAHKAKRRDEHTAGDDAPAKRRRNNPTSGDAQRGPRQRTRASSTSATRSR